MNAGRSETLVSDRSVRSAGGAVLRSARLVVVMASIAGFVWLFQPGLVQWWVDGLWLLAIVMWVIEIRHQNGGHLLAVWPRRADVLPIATLLLVFAAAWLPFYANWRWAYTGDSLPWIGLGWEAAGRGIARNLLSVEGVDGNFTYLHSLAWNSLMFVFGPGLFWHRLGKLIASCLSLAAIYTYFTLMIGRRWAGVIVLCIATNYVWLWFSYVSYGHVDMHIFYFLSLTFATLILRQPNQLGAWMLCGLVGGLALFFTQTSWSAVVATALVLTVFALWTRRLAPLHVYAVSGLLVATPILLQFRGLMEMTARQAHSVYNWNYLLAIFTTILRFPYTSGYQHIGVSGGFLRWPLGRLYIAGAVLAAVAAVPPVRRRLRVPVVAPVMLGLLLWDAILMTATNNGYSVASTKRAFGLIPAQICLALLPFIVLAAWVAGRRWLSEIPRVLVALAIGVYLIGNVSIIASPTVGLYGDDAFDGLIELRQRFADRKVTLLTSREEYRRALAPDVFLHQAYRVLDQLTVDDQFTDDAMERICRQHEVFCYEPHMEGQHMQPLTERYGSRFVPFPLLNSRGMLCFTCAGG